MTLPVPAYIDLVSNFLPLGAGIARWPALEREKMLFYAYLAMGTVLEYVTFVMALSSIHNLWLLQVYDLVEFILLMIVFSLWDPSAKVAKAMRMAIPLYGIFWVIAKFTIEDLASAAEYTPTVSNVIFIMVALRAMVNFLKEEGTIVYRDFRFWVAFGALFYFVGNIPLSLGNTVLSSLRLAEASLFWTIHWYISTASNACYMVGFLCLRKP